jgi:hypothetical protein
MAATQGIRSRFPTQPIPHFPKLRIYEYLFLFNQKLQEAVQILKQLEKFPWLSRNFLRSFQIEVEDLRAQTNFEVLEHMSDREQHDWAHFGKLRREWDRQFEDPDDVYLKAEQREGERRKQGLPPRLGIARSPACNHRPSHLSRLPGSLSEFGILLLFRRDVHRVSQSPLRISPCGSPVVCQWHSGFSEGSWPYLQAPWSPKRKVFGSFPCSHG